MTVLATDRPVATVPTTARARRLTLIRSALLTAIFIVPAVVVRIVGLHPDPVVALLIFGAAVVGASFLLAWAAEAAQIDVSGGLAIAVLALVAVLPEYAVDLYYAYVSGHNADYTQYAAANMTGSNRLLMGLGWPVVVLVSILVAGKTGADRRAGLALEPANRVELGFLLIAGVVAFVIPGWRCWPGSAFTSTRSATATWRSPTSSVPPPRSASYPIAVVASPSWVSSSCRAR
jgi:cation:H+ antiporter